MKHMQRLSLVLAGLLVVGQAAAEMFAPPPFIAQAFYGVATDVTDTLNSMISQNTLTISTYYNGLFGDAAPGVIKTLHITFKNGAHFTFVENQPVSISSAGFVARAWYGAAIDVTQKLSNMIVNGCIDQTVSSSLFGSDPAPGKAKALTVRLSDGQTTTIPEGSNITLSKLQAPRTLILQNRTGWEMKASISGSGSVPVWVIIADGTDHTFNLPAGDQAFLNFTVSSEPTVVRCISLGDAIQNYQPFTGAYTIQMRGYSVVPYQITGTAILAPINGMAS